jgi:chromosome segregation ATPase
VVEREEMSQTILDEYLAAWEDGAEQPNPLDYEFDGIHEMLEESQAVMMDLGESVSRHKREVKERDAEIERLRAALAQTWQPINAEKVTCTEFVTG